MTNIKRNWDLLSEEYRRDSITKIIDFFDVELEQEIGIISGEKILDHFLQTVGMQLYNKGVEDSIAFMKHRFEDLELDMETLLKQ